MNKPTRLFDCIEWQLLKFPKTDMLAAKENGQWRTYSTEEVKATVDTFSAGLMRQWAVSGGDMSDEGCDKIAIISNNRPEWLITDIAVQQTGAALVPIYPTTSLPELEFILNDAQVKLLFVSSEDLYDKVKLVSDKVPTLQQIFSFDKIDGVAHWSQVLKDVNSDDT